MKNLSLRALASLYMASPAFTSISPRSRVLYITAMKSFAHMFDMKANNITRPKLIDLRDQLYNHPHECRMALAVLSNILGYGYERGLCNHNHAARMRHMPPQRAIPRWTDEECELFLKTAPKNLSRVFLVALYTGQRRVDLCNMTWDHYDGKFITVWQRKTKKLLRIPVHPILKKELDVMKEERRIDPHILLNGHGNKWVLNTLNRAIARACHNAGIRGKSIHGLRKTCAAKLAEAGCSASMIKAITGHTSLKEVMRYTAEADQGRMAEEAIRMWANAG